MVRKNAVAATMAPIMQTRRQPYLLLRAETTGPGGENGDTLTKRCSPYEKLQGKYMAREMNNCGLS